MSGDEPHEQRDATAAVAGDRLGEIRARAEASTPGPFGLVPRGFGDYDVEPVDERGEPRGELAALLDALEEERWGRPG